MSQQGHVPASAPGARLSCPQAEVEQLHGDKATMQRVVLEGFAESTSVLREKPDHEYGA